MTRETDVDWAQIGQEEPYHGVFSHERYLRRNLTQQSLTEFWRSGEEEIAYLAGVLTRQFGPFSSRKALDFGCGVGRLTRPIADIAETVIGVDVSPGMLSEARRNAPSNCSFTEHLDVQRFDWINSIIVFQHIPPQRGYVIFEDLMSRLEPGGVVSMHFTLYRDRAFLGTTTQFVEEASWDGFNLKAFHEARPDAGTMLMYDYDLTRLFAIAVRHGVEAFHLEHTNHGGCHGTRLFGRRA